MNKRGLLTLVLGLVIIACGTTNMAISKEVTAVSTKISAEKSAVKRCPCKKIFQERLNMDKEQIKLADTNRKKENEELKPINSKIRVDYKKIKETKNTSETQKLKEELTVLKQQKAEIKVKYNKNFESYLNKEQKQELQKMREDKKAGKSCCPCGKNRYY